LWLRGCDALGAGQPFEGVRFGCLVFQADVSPIVLPGQLLQIGADRDLAGARLTATGGVGDLYVADPVAVSVIAAVMSSPLTWR